MLNEGTEQLLQTFHPNIIKESIEVIEQDPTIKAEHKIWLLARLITPEAFATLENKVDQALKTIDEDWPNIPLKIPTTKYKRTILQWCFEIGLAEKAHSIIKKGGNPFLLTTNLESCLHLACISGDKATIKLALSLDLSKKKKNLANKTPLDLLKLFHPMDKKLIAFMESIDHE